MERSGYIDPKLLRRCTGRKQQGNKKMETLIGMDRCRNRQQSLYANWNNFRSAFKAKLAHYVIIKLDLILRHVII